MMGEKRLAQARRFHESDLKAMLPQNHLLRRIDAVLDPSSLCAYLAPALLPHRPDLDRRGLDDPDVAGVR